MAGYSTIIKPRPFPWVENFHFIIYGNNVLSFFKVLFIFIKYKKGMVDELDDLDQITPRNCIYHKDKILGEIT